MAVRPVTGYVVIHSDGVGEAAVTVGSGDRSYRIGGLTNGRRYTVWVYARNGQRRRTNIGTHSRHPGIAATTTPGPPTDVQAVRQETVNLPSLGRHPTTMEVRLSPAMWSYTATV